MYISALNDFKKWIKVYSITFLYKKQKVLHRYLKSSSLETRKNSKLN